MIVNKSDKELAFINDLFVATDWGERFAELADEHLVLPQEGQILYLASGTGGHAIALQERAGENLRFIAVDENAECVELARSKAIATKDLIEFRHEDIDALAFEDGQFDLVLADASLVSPRRLPKVLAEAARVVKAGGIVMLMLPTASSFGEFFSIYWEAFYNCGLTDHGSDVEALISELPTVSEVENLAEQKGLEEISSWTRVEEFDFDSGQQFLSSPLIADFLMAGWLESVPESSHQRVKQEICRVVDEERHMGEFALSLKATLVVGRKSRSN